MRLALHDPKTGDVVNIVEGEPDVVAKLYAGALDVIVLNDTSAAEPGATVAPDVAGKVRITRPRDGYSTVHDEPVAVPVDAGAEETPP